MFSIYGSLPGAVSSLRSTSRGQCEERNSRPCCSWEPLAGLGQLQGPRGTPWDPQGARLRNSSGHTCLAVD